MLQTYHPEFLTLQQFTCCEAQYAFFYLDSSVLLSVPVYQDTLQPAAKQVGQSLEVVAKTVNIALAPIKALVWGYEKIEEFITTRVSEKLKNVPQENITTPPPQVAGPAVEALIYSGHDSNLRELYANLLANAMDRETIHKAHPGFVEIIKNLTNDEAIFLQAFIDNLRFPLIDVNAQLKDSSNYSPVIANFSHLPKIVALNRPDLTGTYIDNLGRLGILEIPAGVYMVGENIYEPLENDVELLPIKETIEKDWDRKTSFDRKQVRTTTFSRQFVQNVVANK
ncbi:MAG: DUF4393 domain-containing protein [Chitinophagaceae bacterium]|nr:DUF4393 domain-containing protein [Chitinophagaceae bacterium]